jgi:hypothetical protein
MFEKEFNKQLEFSTFAARLIEKELEKQGTTLNKSQKKQLVAALKLREKQDSFFNEMSIQIDDNGVVSLGKNIEDNGPTIDISDLGDIELKRITDSIPSIINEIAEKTEGILLKTLKKRAPLMIEDHHRADAAFQKQLGRKWNKAFKLFKMFIVIAEEVGADHNHEIRSSEESLSPKFEVHSRLHARGCQVSKEIFALLGSGFADGAHARWRTLHELAVDANIISEHDNELSQRYINHDVIQKYKSANLYQEHCAELNFEPIPDDEINILRDSYKNLTSVYGESFKNEYGWASELKKGGNPTFKDLEIIANLQHIRPFYKLACLNVHGGPRGLFFRLGLNVEEENKILLTGPSVFGLSDPIQNATYSLMLITSLLLMFNPNLDCLVVLKVLRKPEEEIFLVIDELNEHAERISKSPTNFQFQS